MQSQIIAKVDLPGFERTDITLRVHQTRLLISVGPEGAAQLLRYMEGDQHVVYRRDHGTGGFFRSILLPDGIQVDDIQAALADGVLVVSVPATTNEETKEETHA